ncbi:MAG: hypothetical protein AAF566_01080 [Pseudomonadota bacterium]
MARTEDNDARFRGDTGMDDAEVPLVFNLSSRDETGAKATDGTLRDTVRAWKGPPDQLCSTPQKPKEVNSDAASSAKAPSLRATAQEHGVAQPKNGWTELAAFHVSSDPGGMTHAEISGFEKGEHLLDVTIYADDSVEEIDVEVSVSDSGQDSILSANGQVLAILRRVPDADLEDFQISVHEAA